MRLCRRVLSMSSIKRSNMAPSEIGQPKPPDKWDASKRSNNVDVSGTMTAAAPTAMANTTTATTGQAAAPASAPLNIAGVNNNNEAAAQSPPQRESTPKTTDSVRANTYKAKNLNRCQCNCASRANRLANERNACIFLCRVCQLAEEKTSTIRLLAIWSRLQALFIICWHEIAYFSASVVTASTTHKYIDKCAQRSRQLTINSLILIVDGRMQSIRVHVAVFGIIYVALLMTNVSFYSK